MDILHEYQPRNIELVILIIHLCVLYIYVVALVWSMVIY